MMSSMWIDLNADVGEGFQDVEEASPPLVSSAHVASGAHAGDVATMERTAALAVRFGVVVGALSDRAAVDGHPAERIGSAAGSLA